MSADVELDRLTLRALMSMADAYCDSRVIFAPRPEPPTVLDSWRSPAGAATLRVLAAHGLVELTVDSGLRVRGTKTAAWAAAS